MFRNLLTTAILVFSFSQQGFAENEKSFTVNGVSFTLVYVEGGSFMMGATEEQEVAARSDEFPVHKVSLSSFYIGKTEVTQDLWKAVMGSNPSNFKGSDNPVERVSWNDCVSFIKKLRELTNHNFRLPTEAEWEYAARGGDSDTGYKFSGGFKAKDVAWYEDNSGRKTHPVGKKNPNEFGLFDMSGNVYEWCQDIYGPYSESSQTDPKGQTSGAERVFRGGSYMYEANCCRVSYRGSIDPAERYENLGLRLALAAEETKDEVLAEEKSYFSERPLEEKTVREKETFTINGVSFTMIGVTGGTFTMGATEEQGKDYGKNEKPSHTVTLSSFQIGQTEVTQELWEAVMGKNPSNFEGKHRPVESVSWKDCMAFIVKLRTLTGKQFRLPTEAEWEYAARGGNKSQHYKYSGSNKVGDVAWYKKNAASMMTARDNLGTHNVAEKAPNELGIYDMTGNVWEWCDDHYAEFISQPLTNPFVYRAGTDYVMRGGAWQSEAKDCRVSRRTYVPSHFTVAYVGLRLAL